MQTNDNLFVDYRLSSFVMIYTFYEDLWFATDAREELYIYIYIRHFLRQLHAEYYF